MIVDHLYFPNKGAYFASCKDVSKIGHLPPVDSALFEVCSEPSLPEGSQKSRHLVKVVFSVTTINYNII